ncbi:hypothetical protein EGR_05064 [Echinococcus granulosus]|uniref:Resistance to inhibitors of cholinesterase protein 3 N-terminal domain-containing protein n=1 Tax=Echinococcus granulosus TaxID=6210 RepID=W6UGG9_ECHGR|nr:hypothetical protein EGR_05064 [Echinococcus granulosus]EUB60066.1 hypothetical protein EGR_05064 [Echinococcus granulosus]
MTATFISDRSIERIKPTSQESEYSQRHVTMPKKKDRDPGIIATILPFYAFGIFIYLVYTIVKLLNNRRKVKSKEKEKHLNDYYRNFCYVSEKGKFKMDSDSSDDEHGNGLRKFRTPCDIGWSSAPESSNATSNVCRSVADLPKDLEYLLKKADEDNLGKLLGNFQTSLYFQPETLKSNCVGHTKTSLGLLLRPTMHFRLVEFKAYFELQPCSLLNMGLLVKHKLLAMLNRFRINFIKK